MVNGLGVLGWGVGGIEAEAAMLGQPISMLLPRVVGIELVGALPAGRRPPPTSCSPSRELLREHGVVGKFVEFYGEGVGRDPASRTGPRSATCRPSTARRARSSRSTTRRCATCAPPAAPDDLVALVETYAKEQGLWHDPDGRARSTTRRSRSTSSTVEPSLAGPARPQDRVPLSGAKAGSSRRSPACASAEGATLQLQRAAVKISDGASFELADGAW